MRKNPNRINREAISHSVADSRIAMGIQIDPTHHAPYGSHRMVIPIVLKAAHSGQRISPWTGSRFGVGVSHL